MDSPLTETFFIVIKIDVHRPLAVRAEVVPSGLGELTPVESKPSVTPLPHGALQNGSVRWNLRCG